MTAAPTLPGFARPVHDAQRVFRTVLEAMSRPTLPYRLDVRLDPPAPLDPATAVVVLALCDESTPLWLDDALAAGPVTDWIAFHTGARTVADPGEAMFAIASSPHRAPALDRLPWGTDEQPHLSATLVIAVPPGPIGGLGETDCEGSADAPGESADASGEPGGGLGQPARDGMAGALGEPADASGEPGRERLRGALAEPADVSGEPDRQGSASAQGEPAGDGTARFLATGPGVDGEVTWDGAWLPAGFLSQWQVQHAQFPRGLDVILTCGDTVRALPRTTALRPAGGTESAPRPVDESAAAERPADEAEAGRGSVGPTDTDPRRADMPASADGPADDTATAERPVGDPGTALRPHDDTEGER